MVIFLSTLAILHLVLPLANCRSNIVQGSCDWTVRSDEPRVHPASVHVVRVYGCDYGEVIWEQPYGGVEITFRSVVPEKTKGSYKVCMTSPNQGFDIFTQNKDKIQLLKSHNVINSSELCVSSSSRAIKLYLEASVKTNIEKASFHYWTVFLGNGHGALRANDCRICSKNELINSYCNGDFAIQGVVRSVSNIGGSEERGEAVVVAKKIFHQTSSIFQKSSNSSEALGNVNFPLYCHWKKKVKHGFLFTGTIEDDKGPVVKCRIKFNHWLRLYHENICDSFTVVT